MGRRWRARGRATKRRAVRAARSQYSRVGAGGINSGGRRPTGLPVCGR
ncbi:hypothetical protein [Photorhabdus cinerea]